MDANSPITARLIFWPVDRESVWLKAEFTPEKLAQMCHDGRCPLEGFLGDARYPIKNTVACDDVAAKDWIRFLSVGAQIGGGNENR